jgi:alkylmercury lyase
VAELQAAALQNLLHTGKPASVDHLATKMNTNSDIISSCIDEMMRTGHIRLDSEGLVIGAVGLSVSPTAHEISIDGKRFWAWCAFDVIGIFGALHASGFVQSLDPSSNEILRLDFIKGLPQNGDLAVFMADLPSGSSVCRDWCSKVNFFTSVPSAQAWIQTNGIKGSLISVGNLVPVAQEVWSRFLIHRD